MGKSLNFLWRGLIIVLRDMFTGYIMGICSALLLFKINPGLYKTVALLIFAGVAAGISKGMAKFIFMNYSGALPSKGYRYNYPKYKMLAIWLVILLGTLLYVFGLRVDKWFSETVRLLEVNIFFGDVDSRLWFALLALITVTGLASYFYEPPVNPDEALPQDENI